MGIVSKLQEMAVNLLNVVITKETVKGKHQG